MKQPLPGRWERHHSPFFRISLSEDKSVILRRWVQGNRWEMVKSNFKDNCWIESLLQVDAFLIQSGEKIRDYSWSSRKIPRRQTWIRITSYLNVFWRAIVHGHLPILLPWPFDTELSVRVLTQFKIWEYVGCRGLNDEVIILPWSQRIWPNKS